MEYGRKDFTKTVNGKEYILTVITHPNLSKPSITYKVHILGARSQSSYWRFLRYNSTKMRTMLDQAFENELKEFK